VKAHRVAWSIHIPCAVSGRRKRKSRCRLPVSGVSNTPGIFNLMEGRMVYVIATFLLKTIVILSFIVLAAIVLVIFLSVIINTYGRLFFERFEHELFLPLWKENRDWLRSFPKLPVKKDWPQ